MIRVGLIGYGYWGKNYARIFSELQEAKLTAICDSDTKRLEEIRNRYPQIQLFPDAVSLIDSPEVDAIVISTPASSHYPICKQCLMHKKNTLVEKPLCLEIHEAKELVHLSQDHGVILMVGHTFLYNPAVQKMKEYITRDDFGRIYYLQAIRTHLGLVRHDVNALWDLAPHDISIFTYLVGTIPTWVSGVGSCFLRAQREDVSFVTLGYDQGILGNIHVSWIDSNKVRTISVVGNNQRIVFDDLNPLERLRIFNKGVSITGEVDSYGEFQLSLRDGDILSPKIDTSEPLKNQCKHFLTCIDQNQIPRSDGINGLDVIRVMKAIEQSQALKGQPVPVV